MTRTKASRKTTKSPQPSRKTRPNTSLTTSNQFRWWENFIQNGFPDFDLNSNPWNRECFLQEDSISRSVAFYEQMNERRSLRFYRKDPIPDEVIENIIKTAGTSPSGAHTEPWTYVVVSTFFYYLKVLSKIHSISCLEIWIWYTICIEVPCWCMLLATFLTSLATMHQGRLMSHGRNWQLHV